VKTEIVIALLTLGAYIAAGCGPERQPDARAVLYEAGAPTFSGWKTVTDSKNRVRVSIPAAWESEDRPEKEYFLVVHSAASSENCRAAVVNDRIPAWLPGSLAPLLVSDEEAFGRYLQGDVLFSRIATVKTHRVKIVAGHCRIPIEGDTQEVIGLSGFHFFARDMAVVVCVAHDEGSLPTLSAVASSLEVP
jgi:hypothetical protein